MQAAPFSLSQTSDYIELYSKYLMRVEWGSAHLAQCLIRIEYGPHISWWRMLYFKHAFTRFERANAFQVRLYKLFPVTHFDALDPNPLKNANHLIGFTPMRLQHAFGVPILHIICLEDSEEIQRFIEQRRMAWLAALRSFCRDRYVDPINIQVTRITREMQQDADAFNNVLSGIRFTEGARLMIVGHGARDSAHLASNQTVAPCFFHFKTIENIIAHLQPNMVFLCTCHGLPLDALQSLGFKIC